MNLPRFKHGTVTILSVDGGGVRGMVPAVIVQDILRRVNFLRRKMHRSAPIAAHQVFDIFAGTSTGALVALGLTKPDPLSPEEIVDVYRHRAATIFPVSRFASVLAMRQAFAEKYDRRPFETVMADLFGDARLSRTLASVLITAYNTDDRGPFFFKHYDPRVVGHHKTLRNDAENMEDFYLRDVARATTAAPTYFTPAQVTAIDGSAYSLVDGGLVANNPALSAYVEARKLFRDARRYVIVSIGTGRSGRRFGHEVIRKWGYLDWVSPMNGVPLTAMMWDGQSEAVAHSLKSLPRVEYFRFNADLGDVSEEMDDARSDNMHRVELLARQIIAERKGELHRLAKILAARRVPKQRRKRRSVDHVDVPGTVATGRTRRDAPVGPSSGRDHAAVRGDAAVQEDAAVREDAAVGGTSATRTDGTSRASIPRASTPHRSATTTRPATPPDDTRRRRPTSDDR